MSDTTLTAAMDALNRADWAAARDGFEAALAEGESGAALEGLSWAAWWLGDVELTLSARERAYRAYRAEGDTCGAARLAAWLASDLIDFRSEFAVAGGWLDRARRMIDGLPACPEHGWILLMQASLAVTSGRGTPDELARLGRDAAQLGQELGVTDLEAIGLAYEGEGLVAAGRVEEGMRRLDEASAVAAGESFELPVSPGWTLCCVITTCEGVGDFARAAQWCGTMRAIAERWGGSTVIGVCRTVYGQVLATGGDWDGAEAELLAAVDDLAVRPGMAAAGLVRLAELRARQGRVDEARELFRRAEGHPMATLGLGELALDDGDPAFAADAAERVLRRIGASSLIDRLPPLELLVRARIALDDLDGAGAAHAELRDGARRVGTPYMNGRADLVGAELALARGDHDDARRAAEDAVDRLGQGAAPYDAALARVVLGRALAALGRDSAAAAELDAAHATFASLGAARDAAAARRGAAGELTARELDVLRLVAQGYSDAEIAARLVVSPHTVHRHVANVRTKLRLPSRSAAVAYAARSGLI